MRLPLQPILASRIVAARAVTSVRLLPPVAFSGGSLVPAAAASDSWFVFAVLSTCAAVGFRMGLSGIGRTLSGPICAMALTFGASGFGVLPEASAQVMEAQSLAVRLATPMLLLRGEWRTFDTYAAALTRKS